MTNNPAILSPIHQLETLAANAWPATDVHELDGWRLRYSNGVTRRANSVWPNNSDDNLALATKITTVEQFYAERKLPARYQIAPSVQPATLDSALADRGYRAVARTVVQTTPLTTILAKAPPLRQYPEFAVEVSETFDESWFQAYCTFAEEDANGIATRRAILQRISVTTGFVTLAIQNEPAAVGLGVVEAGWLGIFCMGTSSAFRRRGAARAILRTLTLWAQLYDANQAYLQVMESNTAARPLYASLGFETLYHYHYREQV